MYRATRCIREHVNELKQRLQHEHDGHKKPRLQMLYLLASGQAHSRQDVAQLLGVHRNTIGRWLAIYAAGGLQALLDTYVPTSKPVSLAPAVLASLGGPSAVQRASLRMRRYANGCGGHTARRSNTKPSTRSCGRASAPSSKCRALATQKKPAAIPIFQATCHEHLQRAIPATNTRPVRVFSQDESRFGLLTVRRRRLTAYGVQPLGVVQHVFEWFY
jgi:hypothetical protein